MVKHADFLVCDSKNIEKYIRKEYSQYHPKTIFIPYGAETRLSTLMENDKRLLDWYQEKGLSPGQFFTAIGRFVPENNFEVMIREFMKSKTKKDFVIITTTNHKFLEKLEKNYILRQIQGLNL